MKGCTGLTIYPLLIFVFSKLELSTCFIVFISEEQNPRAILWNLGSYSDQIQRPRAGEVGQMSCLLPTTHWHRLYPMEEKRYFSLCVVLLVPCAAWIPGKNFSFLFTLEANFLCSVFPWKGQVADTQLCLNSLSFLKMACHHSGPAGPASVESELSKGEQMICLH